MPLWFGFTWGELRRETGDQTMQPPAHAISIFVPGYGLWQVYRHFALIGSLLARVGSAMRIDPLSAAIGAGVWWLTLLHDSAQPIFMLLNAVELAAGAAVVVYGQRALNEYWARRPGEPVALRVLETDWLAIAAAAAFFVAALVSLAQTPTN